MYSKLRNEDDLLNILTELFNNKVGDVLPASKEMEAEMEARYKAFTPPGYKDADKKPDKKYGDVTLWFQMIEKAKESKKPIIFITDDKKDDWWLKGKEFAISPRPELRVEMKEKANIEFYMYNSEGFLESANKYLKSDVTNTVIEEVKDLRKWQEQVHELGHLTLNTASTLGVDDLDSWDRLEEAKAKAVNMLLRHRDKDWSARYGGVIGRLLDMNVNPDVLIPQSVKEFIEKESHTNTIKDASTRTETQELTRPSENAVKDGSVFKHK
jgi:hypothetical protein